MEDEMMAAPLATRCPDPAGLSNSGPTLDVGDIVGLRRKFSFLKDFSDEFIRRTPLEVLLKTETTAIKIREYEKNKAAGTASRTTGTSSQTPSFPSKKKCAHHCKLYIFP
jgi:hypothetical protein